MTNNATYEVLNPEGGLIYESDNWQVAQDVAAQICRTGGGCMVSRREAVAA